VFAAALNCKLASSQRKKWNIGSPRLDVGLAFFEQEIGSGISDLVSKPLLRYN
jgi:hypothetical protein